MDHILKNLIKQFMPFAQKHLGFTSPPRLFLRRDAENANNPLGKTAFYEPDKKSITLYITGRHPKDILRSLGHELVHHKQNCEGKFEHDMDTGPGYAQENSHLRQMEIEANRDGSMCLRDFEDGLKKNNTIYYEHLQKGDNKMSLKDWKEKEISTLLAEAWGFKFNSLQEFEEFDGKGELQAEGEEELEEAAHDDKEQEMKKEAAHDDKEEDLKKEAAHDDKEEDLKKEGADGEELDENHCAGGRDPDKHKNDDKKDLKNEAADGEELEEGGLADRDTNSDRTAGRAAGGRFKKAAMSEAQVRQILKKAIQIVQENNKAAKKD